MSSKFLTILNNSCNDIIEDLDIFPFELDDFQKHACSRISKSENVLVIAKTGVLVKLSLPFMELIIVLKKIRKSSIPLLLNPYLIKNIKNLPKNSPVSVL